MPHPFERSFLVQPPGTALPRKGADDDLVPMRSDIVEAPKHRADGLSTELLGIGYANCFLLPIRVIRTNSTARHYSIIFRYASGRSAERSSAADL